jgi:fatty acid desaturase
VVLPTNPSLAPLQLLQLFSFNLVGARGEPYSYPIVQNLKGVAKLAFTGRFGKPWLEDVYADQPEGRRKSIRWARLTLAFHTALIAASVVFRLWPLPLLVTLAPFIANWLRYFVGMPMHTGLRDNVADFRLCVRSITLDPFSQFLYWRMNWHTEHHMFAAVPCYNLQGLARAIAADMPRPRTLIEAWREMRRTWKRQQTEPGYQFETPLPGRKARGVGKGDSLEGSLGNLAPEGFDKKSAD